MTTKRIYCPIHGFITLTDVMRQIIDTPEFQRLRDLKQLGAAYYVYPSATHSRFAHSLGVSHLAGEATKSLQINQPHVFDYTVLYNQIIPANMNTILLYELCYMEGNLQ